MEEQEYKGLLNRQQSISHVEQHFGELLALLRDMTNYGSNLVIRCLATSKRKRQDAIILGVMLRQALVMFDAIEILVSNASVYSANLQSRALFEVSIIGKYLSRLRKLSHILARQERFEPQLRAPCLPISFGMRALSMTRQIRDGLRQRGIEPGCVPGLQGLDNVA